MPAEDKPYVEPQMLNDIDTQVYEAVATLEYAGGPVTGDQIMSVTGVDNSTVSETLGRLTRNRVLVATDTADGPRYELVRRDWSVTPDIPDR